MSEEFARPFYGSKAWKKCRSSYKHYRMGLCERCLARGEINPGVIVHHKIHLTPENIYNRDITLSWDNLELLCRDCHDLEHEVKDSLVDANRSRPKKIEKIKRYFINADGSISPRGA